MTWPPCRPCRPTLAEPRPSWSLDMPPAFSTQSRSRLSQNPIPSAGPSASGPESVLDRPRVPLLASTRSERSATRRPILTQPVAEDKDAPAMTTTLTTPPPGPPDRHRRLRPSPFSLSIYGDPARRSATFESIRDHGVLVPLVVVRRRRRAGRSSPATAGSPAPGPWGWPRSPARSGSSPAGPPAGSRGPGI